MRAALLLLLLVGCAAGPEGPSVVIGRVAADEAGALVQRWEREWEAFSGMRAAADLRVVRDGRAQRSAAVLLMSPTHLRFELLAPLGFPTLVMTAGPHRITVWNPVERRAWTAPATAQSMSRWMGVPVHPGMLIRLLRGRTPLPPDDGNIRVVQERGSHLAYERGSLRQRVWVTAAGQPARVELEDGERLTARFEWTVSGELQALALELPRRSVEASLRYMAAEYVIPSPEAFEITIPNGIQIQRAD